VERQGILLVNALRVVRVEVVDMVVAAVVAAALATSMLKQYILFK
jgi:hypothetical protein